MKTTDDFFIILVPTRDGKAFIDTIHLLEQVAVKLGRLPLVINCDGLTFWDARNNVMEKLRKALRIYGIQAMTPLRALWCDNDILIDEPLDVLTEHFRKADAEGYNFIANYKTTWGAGQVSNTIMFPNEDGTYENASDKTLETLSVYNPVRNTDGMVGGLGFYYGDIPMGYEYKVYTPYKTEDICFFRDNDLKPRYSPIRLLHNKSVLL